MKPKFLTIILILATALGSFILGGLYFDSYVQSFLGQQSSDNQNFDIQPLWRVYSFLQDKYLYPQSIQEDKLELGAIQGLVKALDDPYTVYLSAEEYTAFEENLEGSFEGIGAELGLRDGQLIVVSPIEGTPASQAGILPGDAIIRIDDQTTEGLSVETAVTKIRGEKGTKVRLDIQPAKETKIRSIEIIRQTIDIPNLKSEIRNSNIGVVSVSQFQTNTAADLDLAIDSLLQKGAKSLILDLRYNPGGYLQSAVDMVGLFVPRGSLVVTEKGKDGKVIEQLKTKKPAKYESMPMVILINEGSASASEIVAGAMRDIKKTQLIGKKSFGKGVVQSVQQFPDGSVLKYTMAEWLTPSGQLINKQGLEPDTVVELTEEDILAKRDPQLDKAIEYLSAQP